MFNSAEPFKGQKFDSLKKDCIKKGTLFVDPEFPPNNKSIFYSKVDREIEWKRPKELCKVPKLVVEGVSSDDLTQGQFGNSWFVSACSSLILEPKLWQKVVPDHKQQEWTQENEYGGIFHFQFWRYGEWYDVVVDDLLPTKNGELVFCHSKNRNEFWSALVEKAYAKLFGDYESLEDGCTADALIDFTGGVAQKVDMEECGARNDDVVKLTLFNELVEAADNKSLIVSSIKCPKDECGQEADQGLIKGVGYIVSSIKRIAVPKGLKQAAGGDTLYLLRLRNPWGNKEWTGPWSDGSDEWKRLEHSEREKLGITFQVEGDFWMSLNDFIAHFTNVDICHFVNTSFFSLKKTWSEAMMHGEWSKGPRGTELDRCGGCETHPTFLNNPQYVFDIKEENDSVMVSLEQDDQRSDKKMGSDLLEIGFHIMKVEENRKFRVHIPGDKISSSEYKVDRSIYSRISLTRGRYVIIPSTKEPGFSGKFLLRVYTGNSANCNIRALLKEGPKTGGCCGKGPVMVMTIILIKAEGLEKKVDKDVPPNPYAEIKCEGETVKSLQVKGTSDPEWGTKAIFYRHKPELPITVEIFNHRLLKDDFLGLATIPEKGSDSGEEKEYELYGRSKKEKEVKYPGKLKVRLQSSYDLTDL